MIRAAHHIAQALCQHRALGHLHLPASCARSIAGPAPCQFCRLFGERSDFFSNKLRKTMENPEFRIEVEKKPEHRTIVKQSVQQQWKILS